MPVKVIKDSCIGCTACVSVCPTQALEMEDDGKAVCKEDACIDCGVCIASCPVEAIVQ